MSYNQLNLSRKKLFSFEFNGTLVKFYEIKENAYAETLENDKYFLAKFEEIKKIMIKLIDTVFFKNYVCMKKI